MMPARRDRGVALLITIMALTLLSAVGTALMLMSTSESIIAAHFATASKRTMPPKRCWSARSTRRWRRPIGPR